MHSVNERQDACEGLQRSIDSISTVLFQAMGQPGLKGARPQLALIGIARTSPATRSRCFSSGRFERHGGTTQPHRVQRPGELQQRHCLLRMASRTERLDRAAVRDAPSLRLWSASAGSPIAHQQIHPFGTPRVLTAVLMQERCRYTSRAMLNQSFERLWPTTTPSHPLDFLLLQPSSNL